MSNSPQESLSKWLLKLIKSAEIYYTKHCIKDSFTFAKEIHQGRTVLKTTFMTSFDVSSLFTNVPVKEAISITADYLYRQDRELQPPVPKDIFEELMAMATINVNFLFGTNVYKQIDGVAMGSPLGPALANIFLGHYEEKLFADGNRPLYYRRYVDDTFVMFRSESEVSSFHSKLNKLHSALKFTVEMEVDGKLLFLDVLVTR